MNQSLPETALKTLAQELNDVGEIPMPEKLLEITKENYHECEVCKAVFMDETDMKIHMTRKHCESSIASTFNCEKCSSTTDEKVVFKHHTLMLHVPGFECHECEQIIFPDDHVAQTVKRDN